VCVKWSIVCVSTRIRSTPLSLIVASSDYFLYTCVSLSPHLCRPYSSL